MHLCLYLTKSFPRKGTRSLHKTKNFPQKKNLFFLQIGYMFPDARKTHISTLIFKLFWRSPRPTARSFAPASGGCSPRRVCPFSEVAPPARSRNPGSAPGLHAEDWWSMLIDSMHRRGRQILPAR
jgi:hypothetical protein